MDDLVIIGLPSSGLHKLTGSLEIWQIEDADIRRAYNYPGEPRGHKLDGGMLAADTARRFGRASSGRRAR